MNAKAAGATKSRTKPLPRKRTVPLVLEVNGSNKDETPTLGAPGGAVIMITPPVGEGYWLLRVKLGSRQAIVGFPKFGTIGIGFAVEEDWNTNLPFTCSTDKIYKHIKHNRKGCRASVGPATIKQAISMVQAAAAKLRPEIAARAEEEKVVEEAARKTMS